MSFILKKNWKSSSKHPISVERMLHAILKAIKIKVLKYVDGVLTDHHCWRKQPSIFYHLLNYLSLNPWNRFVVVQKVTVFLPNIVKKKLIPFLENNRVEFSLHGVMVRIHYWKSFKAAREFEAEITIATIIYRIM